MITSEFDGKYWWVHCSDEAWSTKECMFYYDGIPIFASWVRG